MGEIGAVAIVSGLIQGRTETVPLYIWRALEERQTPSAYVAALTLAAASIVILAAIEWFKHRRIREDEA